MGEWEEKLNQILSSPQAMEQIISLANSIAGPAASSKTDPSGEDASAPSGAAGGLDALLSGLDGAAIGHVMELFSVYQQQGDEKTQLLAALKPFLQPERQARLEQALRITRISRVIRAALAMTKGAEDV